MQRPKRIRKLPLKLRQDLQQQRGPQHLHDAKRKSIKSLNATVQESKSGQSSGARSHGKQFTIRRGTKRARTPSRKSVAITNSPRNEAVEIKQRPRRNVERPESYLVYTIDTDTDDDTDTDADTDDSDDGEQDTEDDDGEAKEAKDATDPKQPESGGDETSSARPRKKPKIRIKERKPLRLRDSDEEDSGDEEASTRLLTVPRKNKSKKTRGTDLSEKPKTFRKSTIVGKLSKLTKLRDLDKLTREEKVAMGNYLAKQQSEAEAQRLAILQQALKPNSISMATSAGGSIPRIPKEVLGLILSFLNVRDHIRAENLCKTLLATSRDLNHSWSPVIQLIFGPSGTCRNVPSVFINTSGFSKRDVFRYAPPLSFWKRILHPHTRELTVWYHPKFENTFSRGVTIEQIFQLVETKCSSSLQVLRLDMSNKIRPPEQSQLIMSAIGKCLQIHTLYIPQILWNCKPEHWQELKPLINLADFDTTHLKSRRTWTLENANFGAQVIHGIVSILGNKPLKRLSFEGWGTIIMDTPTTLLILTMLQGSFTSLESLELPNLVAVSVKMVEAISRFRNLQLLKIHFSTLDKNSLAALCKSGLPIRTLSLSGSVMHADELSYLCNMTHLTSLDLSYTSPELIIQGLQHLVKIAELQELCIQTRQLEQYHNVALDDFNPEILLVLQHLRSLRVSIWQMSRVTRDIFKMTLPRLKIVVYDMV